MKPIIKKLVGNVLEVVEHAIDKHIKHNRPGDHGGGRGSGGRGRKPKRDPTDDRPSGGGGGRNESDDPGAGVAKPAASSGPMSYREMTDPAAGIHKIEKNGQIRLKKPRDAKQSVLQLKQMEKIFEAAQKDAAGGKGMSELRLRHAAMQLQRTMGYARQIGLKSDKTELVNLLEEVQKRTGLKPVDPDKGDPKLEDA